MLKSVPLFFSQWTSILCCNHSLLVQASVLILHCTKVLGDLIPEEGFREPLLSSNSSCRNIYIFWRSKPRFTILKTFNSNFHSWLTRSNKKQKLKSDPKECRKASAELLPEKVNAPQLNHELNQSQILWMEILGDKELMINGDIPPELL